MGTLSLYDWLAFGFSALAYVPYVRGVLRAKTRPTISSWLCWAAADATILVAMLTNGAISWQLVAYCVGTVVVIATSLYKGALVGWQTFDTMCVSIVALSLGLWTITGNPDLGIIFSLVAAIVGSLPFLNNIRKTPHNEQMLPWILVFLGGVFQTLSIKHWNVTETATPLAYLGLQIAALYFLGRKRWTDLEARLLR